MFLNRFLISSLPLLGLAGCIHDTAGYHGTPPAPTMAGKPVAGDPEPRRAVAKNTTKAAPAARKASPAVTTVATRETTPPPAPAPATPPPAPALPEPPPINVIYFGLGSADLAKGTIVTLDRIADYLKASKDEKITLLSYTDPTGSLEKNRALRAKRTQGVLAYLASHGVAADRITVPPAADDAVDPALTKADYWRLRRTVFEFDDNTMKRIAEREKREDEVADTDAAPEKDKIPPRVVVAKPKDKKDKTPTAEPGETNADGLERVDIVYWKSINHGLILVAKKLGYFAAEGLDVRLHESVLEANEMSSQIADSIGVSKTDHLAKEMGKRVVGKTAATQVKSRKYFLGAVCPYGFHEGLAKNLPLVEIGGIVDQAGTMIGKKELVEDIKKNLKSFRGHSIAKIKNGATDIDVTYLFIDRLKEAGLKEGVDFTYKYYSTWDEMHAEHAAGHVDLMVGWNPFDEEYIKKYPQFSLLQLRSLYAYMPCCRQVVLRENLRNPKIRAQYVRFERAIIRAYEYTVLHPDDTARVIAGVLKVSQDVVFSVLRRPGFRFDPNPNVVGAVAFYDAMKGSVPKSSLGTDVRESIDTSVYKEALISLIEKEPDNKFLKSAYANFQKTSEPSARR